MKPDDGTLCVQTGRHRHAGRQAWKQRFVSVLDIGPDADLLGHRLDDRVDEDNSADRRRGAPFAGSNFRLDLHHGPRGDTSAVGDIQELVRHLTQRGIGVLITDHNVRETLSLIHRAYIIYDGQVLTQGKPEEIIANEDVRRVYLGDMFG